MNQWYNGLPDNIVSQQLRSGAEYTATPCADKCVRAVLIGLYKKKDVAKILICNILRVKSIKIGY